MLMALASAFVAPTPAPSTAPTYPFPLMLAFAAPPAPVVAFVPAYDVPGPHVALFPTQYDGLFVFYGGSVHALCLVAVADAPAGMGGVPMIEKGGVALAVYLVETTDGNASSVRMQTSAGMKAIRVKT